MILLGQVVIVYLGGAFFNVEPLELDDLLKIIVVTSAVMLIGELVRAIRKVAACKC